MKKKNVVYIIGIVLFISFIAIDVVKVKEKGGLFSIFNFEETSEKKQIENTLTEIRCFDVSTLWNQFRAARSN